MNLKKHQKTHFQVPYDHLFLNDHSTLQDKYFFHEIDAVSESKKTLFCEKQSSRKLYFVTLDICLHTH
jgi:hypothetical protein